MSSEKSELTSLEARKQLLLVESELNRAQLLNELRDFNNEVQHLKRQVGAIGSMAAVAANLTATFSAVGRAFAHREEGKNGKPSWISTLFDGAKAGTSLWRLLCSK